MSALPCANPCRVPNGAVDVVAPQDTHSTIRG